MSVADPLINGIRNIRDIIHSDVDGITKAKQLSNEIGATGVDMAMGASLPLTYGRSSSHSESHYEGIVNSGSALNAAGNVQLTATGEKGRGDIVVGGSRVSAGEAVIMDARRDVAIVTSADSGTLSSKSVSKGWSITDASGGLGAASRALNGGPNNGADVLPFAFDKSDNQLARTSRTENASLINGADIYINSRDGSVDIAGSALTSANDLLIAAGKGDINVTTGNNLVHQQQSGSHSMVGNLGGDGYSGVVGWRKDDFSSTTDSNQQSTLRSQLVSRDGDVAMQAGKDIAVYGADISAGKSLRVGGGNVRFDVSEDGLKTHSESSSSQYGLKGVVSGWAASAAQGVERAARSVQDGRDPRLSAIYAAQAGLDATTQTMQSNMNPSAVKVTVSATAGKSAQEQDYQRSQQRGSRLHAGESAVVKARNDIVGQGVDISGKNVAVNAGRDIVLSSSQESETLKNRASGSQFNAGVGFSLGGSQNGFTGEFGYSGSASRADGSNWRNQNSRVHADDALTIISGRDTTLSGAELSADKVMADITRNLTIASVQDRATYDSKSTSSGVNLSICVPPFCYGSVAEGNASVSSEKLHNNYRSVNDQSGIYAGRGGFDITAGGHTQLDGAVIASEATADKNRLETGTLGWRDLQNQSQWGGRQAGVAVSGGAKYEGNTQHYTPVSHGMPTTGLAQATGSDSGATRSAVAEGSIILRDERNQRQDIAGLSRDTTEANHRVRDGFDAGKVQDRLAIQKEVTALGVQSLNAYKESKAREADEKNAQLKAELGAKAENRGLGSEQLESLVKSDARYINADKEYGPGSHFWTAGTAATGLLAGALGGNVQGGVAAGAAPFMASLVKEVSAGNEGARIALHGIVSAALAQAQGGDGFAAAAGGVAASGLSDKLAQAFYGKDSEALEGNERDFISNLTSTVGAAAGAATGGGSFAAGSGANAARVEVENNSLSIAQNKSRTQEMAQCQGGAACEKDVIDKYREINKEQHESVVGCKGAQECVDKANEVGKLQADYANRANELMEKGRLSGSLSPEEQNELSILQATSIQLEADRTAAIHNALFSGDSPEAKQLAINSLAQTIGTSAAGIAAGVGKGKGKGSVMPVPVPTKAK